MPPAAPNTTPVLSPSWLVREGGPAGIVFAPDMMRGTPHQLFDFLASNNGAQRQLYGDFADRVLATAWAAWAAGNPSLGLDTPPQ